MSVPISYMYVKRSSRRTPLNIYRWRLSSHFATPTPETHIRRKFSPVLMRVQSFLTFRACLGPLNAIKLEKKKNNNNNNNNNKRSRFIGSSAPSVLGP